MLLKTVSPDKQMEPLLFLEQNLMRNILRVLSPDKQMEPLLFLEQDLMRNSLTKPMEPLLFLEQNLRLRIPQYFADRSFLTIGPTRLYSLGALDDQATCRCP